MDEYITIKKATKVYGVSSLLLRKWEEKGHLKSSRTPLNTRMYRKADLESALGITRAPDKQSKKNFCYCRVSSAKQKDDLDTRKFSCEEIFKERRCNVRNGANYAIRPCYEDINNKETLQWWVIHY